MKVEETQAFVKNVKDNEGYDAIEKDTESSVSVDSNKEHHRGEIGYIGGLSIAVNSIIGPAMLDIPFLYQKSGFIPTTLSIIIICVIMVFCCLHMSNLISMLPDNGNFQREVEYSETFRHYGGRNWFIFTQASYFLCLMCQIIASIVDTAQVVDQFFAKHLGSSGAISVNYNSVRIATYDTNDCPAKHGTVCDPFEFDDGYILSKGYVICLILFLPLGLLNLKENTIWQIFCFIVTIVTCLQFMFFFISRGEHFDNVSMWGESWYSLFGIILFDFTLVTAIPAWLYEKKNDVNATNVIITSTLATSLIYIVLGTLGAIALPNISQNMLSTMMAGHYGNQIQLGAFVFAFVIIGLGIPLFCVLLRLNLIGSGVNVKTANFFAVYLPWSISWLFYNGAAIEQLLSWGGMLFTSICAFLAPLLLALIASNCDREGTIPVWFGYKLSSLQNKIGLSILLALSVGLVILAIVGQLL